jgi:hypothetical protein
MLLSTSGRLAKWFEAAFSQKTGLVDGARTPRASLVSSIGRAEAMNRWRLSLGPPMLWRALAIVFCLFSHCAAARADDLFSFTNVDIAGCDRLDDIRLQVGPPDAEIVAACRALRRSMVFSQSFSGGPAALALSLLGIVLTYAVLGVPMRALTGLMGRRFGRTTSAMTIEALLALTLRGAIGLLLLAASQLVAFAPAIGCLALVGATLWAARRRAAAAALPESQNAAAAPSGLSLVLADVANDVAASVVGVLGLALLARQDLRVLAVGVAVAILASTPGFIAARRRLRAHDILFVAAAAALSAIFGFVAAADPQWAESFGEATLPVLLIPLLFAAAVVGASWIGRRASAA